MLIQFSFLVKVLCPISCLLISEGFVSDVELSKVRGLFESRSRGREVRNVYVIV